MNTPADPMAEIRASFFVECEELLEALQDGLQTISDGPEDAESIHVVFRAVHSIKGGAGAFGLEALVHFAHRFENILDDVRNGRMGVDAAALKVFFQATDHLADLVAACRDETPPPQARTEELLIDLDALLGADSPEKTPAPAQISFEPTPVSLPFDLSDDLPPLPPLDAPAVQEPSATSRGFDILFTPNADLFETGSEPALLFECLAELGNLTVDCDTSKLPVLQQLSPETPMISWSLSLETTAELAEVASIFEFVEGLCTLAIMQRTAPDPEADVTPSPEQPLVAQTDLAVEDISAIAPAQKAVSTPAPKSVVRVDLDRIERLVNLVGELVINQAMLSQSLETSGLSPHSDAMNGLEEFQRLTRDIQDSVMMIRAQPVKSLFQRMARIVREASFAVGKDVRLVTEGDSTEVDKTVIERLADPLTHMIRNAVDHGLEDVATREKMGKDPQGQVRLTAAHRSGRVIIEVSDDGAGIDRAHVLKTAQAKGLIAADAMLSDPEIDNLLFLPGFSTVTEVSDLSGRGVGMDVVRTEIQSLGGRVTIHSDPGVGTRFSISLPLTLAVLDGMIVEVAGQTLVLPLNLVIETLTLAKKDVQSVRPGHPVIEVRGTFVPVIDLGLQLGYRAAATDFEGTAALLIRDEDGTRAALIIDDILDQRQVVIKGLNDGFYRAPGVAAATILGDGQIALILEPSDIMNQAFKTAGTPPPSALAPPPAEGLHP